MPGVGCRVLLPLPKPMTGLANALSAPCLGRIAVCCSTIHDNLSRYQGTKVRHRILDAFLHKRKLKDHAGRLIPTRSLRWFQRCPGLDSVLAPVLLQKHIAVTSRRMVMRIGILGNCSHVASLKSRVDSRLVLLGETVPSTSMYKCSSRVAHHNFEENDCKTQSQKFSKMATASPQPSVLSEVGKQLLFLGTTMPMDGKIFRPSIWHRHYIDSTLKNQVRMLTLAGNNENRD